MLGRRKSNLKIFKKGTSLGCDVPINYRKVQMESQLTQVKQHSALEVVSQTWLTLPEFLLPSNI